MAPYLYTGKPKDLNNLSSRAELQVGRFVYDGDNHLMRGTRYGVKLGGIIDLLISDSATWVLTGSYENPQCMATLAKPYKVPSRTWQDPEYQPVCVGVHATAPTINAGPKVQWWKQKSPVQDPGTGGAKAEAADWFWFDDQNGYPTRTMFWYKHDGLPAIIGDYAFTNFYKFGPGNDIDLTKIRATCESAKLPVWNDDQVAALQSKAAAPQANPASTLIPGLSYKACAVPGAKPPTWPVQIYMSSFSTAAKYDTPKPLATAVYYRPNGPQLRTRLHEDGDHAPFWSAAVRRLKIAAANTGPKWSDALLIGHDSYGVDFSAVSPNEQLECVRGPHTSLPGPPHEDWGVAGHCQCMSVIQDNPVFSPGRDTEIIGCPLPLIATNPTQQSGNTMFWMWYTMSDPMRPVVFLQTKPDVTIGTGLSLADYVDWQQKAVPDDIFTTPAANSCEVPPASAPVAPGPCMGCHNSSTNN